MDLPKPASSARSNAGAAPGKDLGGQGRCSPRNTPRRFMRRSSFGGDPAAEKAISKIQAGDTFGKLIEQYLEFQKGNSSPATSYAEVERHLKTHAKPLHALPAITIRSAHNCGQTRCHREGERGRDRQVGAGQARRRCSAGPCGRDSAASNPVAKTNKREEKSRDRILSDAELRTISGNRLRTTTTGPSSNY